MSKWEKVYLTDVTSKIGDGLHGTPKYDDNGDYYFINGNNLNQGKILIKPDTKRVNKEEYLKHTKPISDNTILLSINGTIGNLALYNGEKCMLGKSACYINVNEATDRSFLYYVFCNNEFQYFITENATGTTIPNVPLKGIRKYTFNLPPLPEQKAIAAILSSLDDKIDLLHRQNKTLEAMAETLFRQWFVEEVGEDWEEGKIDNLFILQRGFDLPVQKRIEGLYPIYAASGFSGRHIEYKVKAPGVTTGRSGLLGKVFFIMENFWPLNTSLFIKEYKKGTPLFSYFFLKNIDLKNFNAGSAVPTLNRNHVHEHETLIPPKKLIQEFEELIIPYFQKIKFNKSQIQTLAKLRDTLLPKLMSGEVRVKL